VAAGVEIPSQVEDAHAGDIETEPEELLRAYTRQLFGSRGKVWWGRLRYEAGSLLRRFPALYLPIARRRRRAEPLTSETELVVEGFPRSGNTFAVASFGTAQTRPVKLARHEHAAAQVLGAVRRNVPVLVLIRRPDDAILSLAVQQPQLTVRQLLRSYLRFYRPLRPCLDRLVVATFDQVTTDFGAVTRRVNDRYGTAFGVFDHTEENARRSLEEIERRSRDRWGQSLASELKRSAPSEVKDRVKAALRTRYAHPRLARLRAQADDAYGVFARAAEGGATA
jgi:hypothetical protein